MKNFLLALTLASTLSAAPPVLTRLEPWGAQRGKSFTLTLAGTALAEGSKIVSTLPATFTALAPAAESAGKRLPFLVELKPDTPVGLYPIRIESPSGISNILLFSIGVFPEIKAEAADKPQRIQQTPITINGTLRPAAQARFEIYGKGGERRIFEVEARRMGSAIDPSLRVYDTGGKLLARVEDTPGLGVDCRLEFTFPREGNYIVEVHDARFSDQAINFYRLKVGHYSYAEAIFPLGWTRGKAVEVEFSGGNLSAPVKAHPENGMVYLSDTTASLPIPFTLSDLPESLEPFTPGPHSLAPGTVVNGRIGKPGEIDRYRLAVKPGKTYLFELGARALGPSRLDALLTVYNSKGEKLDSAGDQPPRQAVNATIVAGEFSTDPFLLFEAPAGTNEITVAVEDLNGNGGPAFGYRLHAAEQQHDFELTLSTPYVNIPAGGSAIVTVNVERRGYSGDIFLTIPGLPEGVRVAGGSVPAEVVDIDTRAVSRRGVLTLSAEAGTKARSVELAVWGEATLAGGARIRRKASGPGMVTNIRGNLGFVDSSRRNIRPFQAPWLGLGLPAAISAEPVATLSVDTPNRVRIIQGMKYDFPWKFASKTAGIQTPRTVSSDTPGGRDLRLSDRSSVLTMNTTIGTPPGIFDVILSARAAYGSGMMGGAEEIVYAPAITVEVVQGYAVNAPKQSTPLKPNGQAELAGVVTREPGFTSPITIAPDALPLQVACAPVDVGESSSQYRIACQAGPEAPLGEHKILLNPSSILPEGEKGKVPYKIPPVEATLVIAR